MSRKVVYKSIRKFLDKIGKRLNQYNVNPSQLTLIGLLFNALGCLLFAYGHFFSGSFVIWFAAIFDMLDGAVARASGQETRFGAFIDSVIDRYSDFFIFGGILIYFVRTSQLALAMLVLVVIAGAALTSYTKARAENIIEHCDVGWVERPERIFIICAAGIFGFMIQALWILAFMTHLTALQRIYHTWKETTDSPITPKSPQQKDKTGKSTKEPQKSRWN